MQKMQKLSFVKTTLYITTKIQHNVGFVITQETACSESVSIEVNFWRENLDEISSGQISYLCRLAMCLFVTHCRFWESVVFTCGQKMALRALNAIIYYHEAKRYQRHFSCARFEELYHIWCSISHYSSLPNKRTCTPYLILTKLPPSH